jgi:phage-Barnase-EndoU-ColicinE5/D-RelE like nuclease2
MPTISGVLAKPPERLVFTSLAELYQQFIDLFVGKDFCCPRGIKIVFTRHHFFHLVKLVKGTQTFFTVEEEEPSILSTRDGFGGYSLNEGRAQTLSWIPEILKEPDEIWEYTVKKTADEAFIREYDKSGSPFRVALLRREGNHLEPVTCMTVRRTGIKEHRKGRKLWPVTEEAGEPKKNEGHSG